MEIKRFSKSLYRNALICPWRADQIHNKHVKTKMGKPALDGIEVHALRAEILAGKVGLQFALDKASNDDVRRLLELAISNDPWAEKGKRQIHESRISLDIDGQQIKSKADETFLFILDRMIKDPEPGLLVVEDLKTGAWEKDDALERHGYVFGAAASFPKYKKIRFEYAFCASGNRLTFDYEWTETEHTCVITCPQDPDYKETLICHERHPLLDYLLTAYNYVKELPCEPTPGEHCQNLYGEPCQFLTTTCPLNNVPVIVEAAPVPATVQAVMDLPAEKRIGAAFLLLLSDEFPDDQITPELKSLAWQGIAQLRNGATRVMKRIKDTTLDSEVVTVGESHYGWRPKSTVDGETAFELMLTNDLTAAQLAKVASVSVTGINRLPKAYSELKESLLAACVDESGDREFGLIKN